MNVFKRSRCGTAQALLDARAAIDTGNQARSASSRFARVPAHVLLMQTGTAPLYAAAERGNIACVRLLLDRRASVNRANSNGASSLFIAAQNGHTELAALLLEHKVIARPARARPC